MRRRRRDNPEGQENNERWLITYSDLITLLMIFFVIMYAMSKVDVAKFMTLTQSLAAAMHNENQIPLKDLGTTGLVVPANPQDTGNKKATGESEEDKKMDNLFQQVSQYIQEHHLQENVSIVSQPRGIQITLKDVVLFDTGQATIKPGAKQLLAGLVPFFRTLDNPIVVEGYTDNRPISTGQYPSNWELPAARATGVVRFFVSQHVDPNRLTASGYGEYHPVAPNDTEAHRQENRRVNIVILRDAPVQMQDSQH
ncbi:flagellar motor protein MotB [Alicyclobacillus pomorum]|uniref:flagellar motor protein MotB n=1 Tax=Alicyclobacillus pomorum TaxID=204470 RepID=UPI000423C4EA|nr:flagellar motor protein MotB [Alicyclobacillus pomorum]